jgi:hypothetical protein
VVGYTANDIDMWASLMARSIRSAGGRAGDIVHIAYGYGLFTGGLGAHYGAERLGCTVIPMSGGQTEKHVQLIVDFRPDIIMVTPSYMLNIAEEFVRQGRDPREHSLKIGIAALCSGSQSRGNARSTHRQSGAAPGRGGSKNGVSTSRNGSAASDQVVYRRHRRCRHLRSLKGRTIHWQSEARDRRTVTSVRLRGYAIRCGVWSVLSSV